MTASRVREQARSAADQHLERIRSSYGLNQGSSVAQHLVKTAESGCQILAEQLYQKATHFLLELVQNADDATYHDPEPTLHFTYMNGFLRIDCNEVGFSPNNVDALCSLGQSSKAGAGVATQFVGEKGIGFKSVFKVADQVWVSSRHYEFKFDKNAKLGMVAPILESFPVIKRDGWTSFYLRLTPGTENVVVSELQGSEDMKPQILLFLRNLRKVVLTVQCSAGSDVITTTWRREDAEFAGQEVKDLHVDNNKLASYLFMRHWADGLPGDERREGVTESEVILAFPLDNNNEPRLESQVICAYLPIRDYGFHFLIQADFLLIASREDVDNSAAWNVALREACVKALDNSVQWFNNSTLKFVWPRYLPAKLGPSDFFHPLKKQMLVHLSLMKVLEDLTGQPEAPRNLIYVPRTYRDDSGEPLTKGATTSNLYLSTQYDDLDYKYLQRLGVREMDHGLFLDHLEKVIANMNDFIHRPAEWHSRLAGVLAEVWDNRYASHFKKLDKLAIGEEFDESLSDDDFEIDSEPFSSSPLAFRARVRALPVVPLRDGRWVSGRTDNLLLAASTSDWELPGGMGLSVIDSTACQDSRRENLYRLFGAKTLEHKRVCQLIVNKHTSPDFKPDAVLRADLISQAKFLYTSGWRNDSGAAFIWLATEFDGRAKCQDLYIDTEKMALSATHFFAVRREVFLFIHEDYLSAVDDDGDDEEEEEDDETKKRWIDWLKAHLCLSEIPRLIRIIRRVSSIYHVFEMSPEFDFIITEFGEYYAIKLICEYWDIYRFWVVWPRINHFLGDETASRIDPAVDVSYRQVQKKIRFLKFKCTDGTVAALENTVLPLSDIPKEVDGCVSFLKLREPDHKRWKHLEHFGVGVTQNLDFYFRCLQNFSRTKGSLRKATFIYEQIQARSAGYMGLLDKFKGSTVPEKLVYVPLSQDVETDPDNGSWVPIDECLWRGPNCMRAHFCLHNIYPSCQRLFDEILDLENAGMPQFLSEAKRFEIDDSIEYIRSIFFQIENCMKEEANHTEKLSKTTRDKIIPVTDTATAETFGQSFNRLLTPGSEFFIADTKHMLSSFVGLVPLLAFGVDDLAKMKRLLQGLQMNPKRLGRAAQSLPRTTGKGELHRKWTEWFQARFEFMARLVEPSPTDPKRQKGVRAMLRNIEVHYAEYIVQTYRVKIGSTWVHGRERSGNVVLTPSENSLQIFLKKNYLEDFHSPAELSKQLAELTSINERHNGLHLLHIVLTEPDLNRLADIFDQEGVPSNFDDDEEVDDSWLKHPKYRMGTQNVPKPESGRLPGVTTAQGLHNMFGDADSETDEDEEGPGVPRANGAGSAAGSANGPSRSPWAGRSGVRMFTGAGARGPRQHAPPQAPIFDEELESRGQLFFSTELSGILNDHYKPELHWTSPLRTKHGLPPYTGDTVCSFTINDAECNGEWTKAVAEAEYHDARQWIRNPPKWHIEVRTVKKKDDEFVLTHAHFSLARRLSVERQRKRGKRVPTEVMMLVVVYEMEGEEGAKFEMLPDPWGVYLAEFLKMKPTGDFVCKLAMGEGGVE